jgi:peptidoglycan/xylan/chitin deacetylase (PgdA/CDA1 family)
MFVRVLKLLLSLTIHCADCVATGSRRLLGLNVAPRCVVLYYHAVRSAAKRQFASQMDELVRLSTPIDIEGDERLLNGRRYSAVTFDDAFMSVVMNALPVLKERRIPCTIFVPTGSIGRHPSWIAASHEDGAEVVFSAEVMQALAKEPLVGLGSHSVSHPNFRSLDDQRARDELIDSKAAIERIVGTPVTSFSFPHGAHTQRSVDLAAECGYRRVLTIEPLEHGDPIGAFVIGRVRVEPHDWPMEFRLKLQGAYRWMPLASKLKRSLLRLAGREHRPTAAPHGA